MKIFNSIKWRLQIWYGLILVAVLAGFGFTAYQLESNSQFRRIDNELQRRIGVLKNALHHPLPRRGQNAGRPPFDGPPRDQNFDEPPQEGPPPDPFSGDGPPEHNARRPLKFTLPEQDIHFFDVSDPHNFYFIIDSSREGPELAHSTNAPPRPQERIAIRSEPVNSVSPRLLEPPSLKFSNYHARREILDILPSGEWMRVGCFITPELSELRSIAIFLTLVGGFILLVGLAGGWWLVSRSLHPITRISATAVKISAGDLSQRINVAEAESELGQLAAVLNSTFARLETAFAQQKQFASDAAHELRTPVTVILTQTQMALARERDAASYKQTIEACQRAAQRMRRLIESLLELARFDAGQEVLKRMDFDFGKTVSDSVELVQTLAEEKSVKIISEASPLEISGDAVRLAQVVTNLLTNAIQYNRPGGEVRVELDSENGLAVLKISDTGQGIAPDDLSRVFERFYRADQSRTGAGNAGLGLAICKAIVEAHGGTLEVASELQRGTTFTVRLSLAS